MKLSNVERLAHGPQRCSKGTHWPQMYRTSTPHAPTQHGRQIKKVNTIQVGYRGAEHLRHDAFAALKAEGATNEAIKC